MLTKIVTGDSGAGVDARRRMVTVGMPVRDCERTVSAAIRSILWQSYSNWELLILDDGSTDRTLEIVERFQDSRIRIVTDGASKGLSARLNQAISLGRGEYFARMDGDDISYPERLERQILFLRGHPEIDLLGAGILVFRDEGQALGTRVILENHEEICRRPSAGFYLPHPTWMGRTAWFRRHLYRAQAVRMEDQDLMLRAHRTSRFANLPEILLGYREDSFSLRKALAGRYHFMSLLAFDGGQIGIGPLAAWSGIARHALKAGTEIFAAGTGLTYRVLGHRAVPVSTEQLARWRNVYGGLMRPEAEAFKPIPFSSSPASETSMARS
jgi:glycosyltransferase involved in cell wall biosynthesis